MEQRGNRDEIVLATKFTTYFPGPGTDPKIRSNHQGNHAKSLRVSLEASLRKLKTSYIDLVRFKRLQNLGVYTNIPSALRSLVGLHHVHS